MLDPEGLKNRVPGNKKKKKKGNFPPAGPNFVHSLDGHDKIMGYQNSTFPLAIYGCIDTCSRKMLWIKVWVTNSNPIYPALWYVEHLRTSMVMPQHLRLDKGTETVEMAAIHAFLKGKTMGLGHAEASRSVTFGPSTSNQV